MTLQVAVNERAMAQGLVKNQAFVKVNGDPEIETEVPKNPTPGVPKTGDVNRPGPWLAFGALCLTGLACIGIRSRRHRKKNG